MELISAFFTFGSLWCGAGVLASMKVSDNQVKIEKTRLEQLKEQRRIDESKNPATSRWVTGTVEPNADNFWETAAKLSAEELKSLQRECRQLREENERLKQQKPDDGEHFRIKLARVTQQLREAQEANYRISSENERLRALNKKGE